jgi:hypothetical protein
MQAKLTALFTTTTGWAHIVMFLIGGFTVLSTHGQSWAGDAVTILTVLGGVFFPTDMVAGSKVQR